MNPRNVLPFSRSMGDSESLRERCVVRLFEALREPLEKVYTDALQAGDDALFDRAEKAGNATQQSDFFDTMRRLRLAKPDLASRALSVCKQELEVCLRLNRGSAKTPAKTSLDELSLVDADTVESEIAITTAANKARSRLAREWQQLEMRVDQIFAGIPDMDAAGRRFGPELFAEAFGKAIQHFECTIEIRITLIKFVERELVQASESIIAVSHQALTDCGVAQPASPVASFRPLRASPQAAPATPQQIAQANLEPSNASTGGYAPVGANELDPSLGRAMQDFLAHFSAPMPASPGAANPGLSNPAHPGPAQGYPPPTGHGGPMPEANVNDVLRAIASLDQKFRSLDQQVPVGGDVASALREQLSQGGAGGQATNLRALDAGVIDLISLMFEYAINDKHLPGALQASIARLQIPYLKLALIDPQFLARRDHPARRLLDELAQAAMGWIETSDRGLRELIDGIVAALVDGFKDDTAIFERQRTLLGEFMRRDGARTEIAEKRAVQAADGKSKMEAAQRDAAAVLKQKLEGSLLPKALSSMVRESWSNYMVLTLLRHGQDSTAWSEAIRLLELIARFPRADADLVTRADWQLELDGCEPIMRKGLAATGVHDEDIEEVLSGLRELLHLLPSAQAEAGHLAPATIAKLNVPPPIPVERVVFAPTEVEVVTPAVDDLTAELEEIQRILAGTWIEMDIPGKGRERVKLLWVSGDRRNYLFVNANGIKVADKKAIELAAHLKAGDITILDKKPLVERAFEAAMAKVRQFRAESKKA
ncbi:MAG: DUF1631 domain-containing protein [Ahniella sp.]|nr:DUF1631 domain-containing protein [Ahniella sp.]